MAPAATMPPAAMLTFDGARLDLAHGLPATRAIDLAFAPGEFVLCDSGDDGRSRAFADAAAGIRSPSSGRILFLGRDWAGLGPDDANALRGRIGRLVGQGAWIDDLSVEDNVLVQQLHHTRRDAAALLGDAARLARHFGLPGLPVGMPSAFCAADLARAALVRAFLGRPRMVILEHDPLLSEAGVLEALVDAVRVVRDRGGIVVWLTLDPRIWDDASLPATRRLRIIGGEIREEARPT